MPRITQELGGNEYEDVSAEIPNEEDWEMAQDPTQANPPTTEEIGTRMTGKRSPEGLRRSAETNPPPSKTARSSGSAEGLQCEMQESAWWNLLEEPLQEYTEGSAFWTQESAAVEIEIPMPESKRGIQKAIQNLESYFVGAFKRRAVEVNEKRLTPEERQKFKEAKDVEVRNFIAAKAFEALPPELRPDRSQAIGMRWLLTWKLKEDGTKKAKARAILQGYQDPEYEYRATTTPVMTRLTRQLLLHEAARQKWKVKKGDVTGAF